MTPDSGIVWRCDACGERVEDGTGALHVDYLAAQPTMRTIEVNRRQLGERPTLTAREHVDLLCGSREPWQVHHHAWYAVERASTVRALLERNRHLASKGWLVHTDWADFMVRVCERSASEVARAAT